MSFLSLATAGLVASIVYYIACKLTRNATGEGLPPGDLGWPIIGNMLEFVKDQKSFADRRPAISSFRFLWDHVVLVKDAEMAETLVRSEGRLIEANFGYLPGMSTVFGTSSILVTQGARHKHLRAQMMPGFSQKALDSVFYTHQQICRKRMRGWQRRCTFDGSKDTRDISADMGCAFIGIDILADSNAGPRVMELSDTILSGVVDVPINIPGIPTRYRAGVLAREEVLDTFVRPIIKERRDNPRTGVDAERDFPTLMLSTKKQDGTPLDDVAIEENLFSFILAAVDTTWIALMLFVLTMCTHPEVQEKIRTEVLEVLGDKYRNGEQFSPELLESMTYLDQVLQEMMRMYPVVAGLTFRRAKVAFKLGDYNIPKGMLIRIASPQISKDPKVWSNPEKFDPSRFAPDGEGIKNRKTLLEFGFGSRMCIGKKLAERERKLFAIFLLRDHRVEFVSQKPPQLSPWAPFQRVVGDFPVRLVPA